MVVVGIGSGLGVSNAMSASAAPSLPAKTPATLLSEAETAHVSGFSGTVVQHADLGLPDVSGLMGGRGSTDLSSLITGSHTMRVWYAGPQQVRMALLGTLGESDLIRNKADLWQWSSTDNSVTHYALPKDNGKTPPKDEHMPALTPQQAAEKALAAVNPTTKVTTEGTVSLAGRSAYQLAIAPRDTSSLVGSVKIAIDANTHEPLRVQIYAKGKSSPAFEVGFTQISFSKPSSSEFQFTPPQGAKVKQGSLGALGGTMDKGNARNSSEEPTVVGKGWTQVLVLKNVTLPHGKSAGELNAVLGRLPHVSGSWGSGRVFTSSLFNALFTDDGRLVVGAVPTNQLYAAASHR